MTIGTGCNLYDVTVTISVRADSQDAARAHFTQGEDTILTVKPVEGPEADALNDIDHPDTPVHISNDDLATLGSVLYGEQIDGLAEKDNVIAIAEHPGDCRIAVLSGQPRAEFVCLDCEKSGNSTGHPLTAEGAIAWHTATL